MEASENAEPAEPACVRCGSKNILASSRTPLCSECREWFIKFPIPNWLKYFAAGIGVVLIFSLVNISKSISPGIHLSRGIKAEEERKYLTARNEFVDAARQAPGYIKAQAHLLIASFYNQDMDLFSEAYGHLEGKDIEDSELLERLNNVTDLATKYYPSDKFSEWMKNYKEVGYNIPGDSLRAYIEANEPDIYAYGMYAGHLFKDKNYESCDSILDLVLAAEPEYIPALCFKSTLKRESGKFDESIYYCNKVLDINAESLYALSSKARTFLKLKRDEEALQLSLETSKLDPKDGYTLATLILAQHFNSHFKERDELLSMAKAMNDSDAAESIGFAEDVINKKEFFRN